MSLASRIEKLEKKSVPQKIKIYWVMWSNCKWVESQGLLRRKGESVDCFKKRVLEVANKQFLWVK